MLYQNKDHGFKKIKKLAKLKKHLQKVTELSSNLYS